MLRCTMYMYLQITHIMVNADVAPMAPVKSCLIKQGEEF